ncbi:unnamed protein product [Rotaria magnacalcarata]|uniref:Uncharacterized protein n=1 Tax=Rotaria magnacalcarata TaxID=392030 RepID=A0A816PF14_9BILA|nr:unnamed protein product [Rotaria magnacalcarata]CAF2047963.1 unnamed protein product [Rotaria magnacalcarata]CAF3988592.1 unnamed protein product [Rotaria magnacalcarata]CAF4007821.1 unnamed protein product [Rotaria magnacalcarata]
MNLLNIVKYLFYLTQTKYGSENAATTADEIFTAERLLKILKSLKESCLSELYIYDTLKFDDEYEEMTNTDERDNVIDDYNENEYFGIQNRFTIEEMKNIIEWIDQCPNAIFPTISNGIKKTKSMKYIRRFRECMEKNGPRLEKLQEIKEFMPNEFYRERAIEKVVVQDDDLELYAIQKAR